MFSAAHKIRGQKHVGNRELLIAGQFRSDKKRVSVFQCCTQDSGTKKHVENRVEPFTIATVEIAPNVCSLEGSSIHASVSKADFGEEKRSLFKPWLRHKIKRKILAKNKRDSSKILG